MGPSISIAQIIGDDALRKIEQGRVSTLEGEFVAFLDDTVSPDFIKKRLSQLGFTLGVVDIQPFTIAVVNQPADSVLSKLSVQPEIRSFSFEPDPVDTAYFRELLSTRDLAPDDYEQSLKRIVESQSNERLFIRFHYSLNKTAVQRFMQSYRSVAYEVISDFPRSVNIVVDPGKENDVMMQVEQLPFVESTALIGIIGE